MASVSIFGDLEKIQRKLPGTYFIFIILKFIFAIEYRLQIMLLNKSLKLIQNN